MAHVDNQNVDLVRAEDGDVLVLLPHCIPSPDRPVTLRLGSDMLEVLQNGVAVISMDGLGDVWKGWLKSAPKIVVSEFDDERPTVLHEGVELVAAD